MSEILTDGIGIVTKTFKKLTNPQDSLLVKVGSSFKNNQINNNI